MPERISRRRRSIVMTILDRIQSRQLEAGVRGHRVLVDVAAESLPHLVLFRCQMNPVPTLTDPSRFWELADHLVATSQIVIDRPAGSTHPRVPEVGYPLDYGYLDGTSGGDGEGIDVWRGSLPDARVTGAIMTVDLRKRDAEVK